MMGFLIILELIQVKRRPRSTEMLWGTTVGPFKDFWNWCHWYILWRLFIRERLGRFHNRYYSILEALFIKEWIWSDDERLGMAFRDGARIGNLRQ